VRVEVAERREEILSDRIRLSPPHDWRTVPQKISGRVRAFCVLKGGRTGSRARGVEGGKGDGG
jgi:hypothetical protein